MRIAVVRPHPVRNAVKKSILVVYSPFRCRLPKAGLSQLRAVLFRSAANLGQPPTQRNVRASTVRYSVRALV